MKKYRANMFLYLILPVIIISIILIYGAFLFRQSYTWVNVANISLDVIILVYYSYKFCYEIDFGETDIFFHIALKKYKIHRSQIKGIIYTSFLIRIVTDNRVFYLAVFPRDVDMLRKLFKDIQKQL